MPTLQDHILGNPPTDRIVNWHFAQVLDRGTIGGAERHTWLLSLALARAGWPVTFAAPPGPLWEQIGATPDMPDELECRREPGLGQHPLAAAKVLRRVLETLPSRLVVHSHIARTDVTAAVARRTSRPDTVFMTTVHSQFRTDVPWRRSPFKRALYYPAIRWAWHQMDIVFAVSQATARQTREHFALPAAKVVALQNAVDLRQLGPGLPQSEARRQLGMAPTRPVVTTVGVLNHRKGQHVLLQAIAKLPDGVRPEVWLVGTGPDADALGRLADRLDIGHLVTFFGRRDDVPLILSASDVYAQPSFADPLPRALLEAMALGLPSIASAVDGIPEMITDGETGWLVPVGDPAALANRLTSVLQSDELAARVGRAGQQLARARCSIDAMATAVVAELDRRFGPSPRRASASIAS